MKKIIIATALVLGSLASVAIASPNPRGLVFQCTFPNDKSVTIVEDGDASLTYSFVSSAGNTELTITNKYGEMKHDWFYSRPENFVGGSLTFVNGPFNYQVTQIEKDGTISGSITVTKKGKYVVGMDCKEGFVEGIVDSADQWNDIPAAN